MMVVPVPLDAHRWLADTTRREVEADQESFAFRPPTFLLNSHHSAMSNPPMEDDADPTYSHFAHRAEFEVQLARFLAIDVAGTPSTSEDDAEVRLVNSLGAIVSTLPSYLPLPPPPLRVGPG